jgi:DNA repair exonuclease SbcCD ATPase subunit
MIEMHDNLKTLRGEQKQVEAETVDHRDTLVNLEQRQQIQREDVERMKQRDLIKRRLKNLQMARPIPRYNEAHKEWKELKEKKKNAVEARDQLKAQLDPFLRSVNDKKEYQTQLEAVVKQKQRFVKRGFELATGAAEKLEEVEEKLKDLGRQIDAEKKSTTADVEARKKLSQNIAKLKRQMEQGPVEFDHAAYTAKLVSRPSKFRAIAELRTNGCIA